MPVETAKDGIDSVRDYYGLSQHEREFLDALDEYVKTSGLHSSTYTKMAAGVKLIEAKRKL